MSATLAVLLKELDPNIKLEIVELQESGAIESSNPWNNAGTGHAGLCELNYTPDSKDGTIDIKKAVLINTSSKSRSSSGPTADREGFGSPRDFINPVPHLSFVRGSKNIDYLKRRFDALKTHHAFADMEYSEDRATLAEWMPLMMPGRDPSEPIAATRAMNGTDVNFGAVTSQLLGYGAQWRGQGFLQPEGHRSRPYRQRLEGRHQEHPHRWLASGASRIRIPRRWRCRAAAAADVRHREGKGFGGFPVSGRVAALRQP